MEIKKTKQSLMGLAALMVLFYHLWPVPRGNNAVDSTVRYLLSTAYIAVDLFFFLSAYTLRFSRTAPFWSYVKRRFLRIYPVFILSCLMALALGLLPPSRLASTLLGWDLLAHGGASFLWFLPAIMITYLATPLLLRWTGRMARLRTLLVSLLIWGLLVWGLEQLPIPHAANLFLCRLPIFLIGLYLAHFEGQWSAKARLLAGLVLFCVGVALTRQFGFQVKLNQPITSFYLLCALPQSLGLILLLDLFFGRVPLRFFAFLGRHSLSLYAMQMVWTRQLLAALGPLTGSALPVASLLAMAILLAAACLLDGFVQKGLYHVSAQRT